MLAISVVTTQIKRALWNAWKQNLCVDGYQMCATPTSRCLCLASCLIPLTMLELVATGKLTECGNQAQNYPKFLQ